MNAVHPPIILTRPTAASQRFADQLRDRGYSGEVILSPVLRIAPLPFDLPPDMRGAVFTSASGVRPAPRQGMPAWCVGDETARCARSEGWSAMSAGKDAEALVKRILSDGPTGPLCHFRGVHSRGRVAGKLTDAGIATAERIVYDQRREALTERALHVLNAPGPVILPLFSPNSANSFVHQAGSGASWFVAAMSPAIAGELDGHPIKCLVVADVPSAQAMLDQVFFLADAACRIEGSAPDT